MFGCGLGDRSVFMCLYSMHIWTVSSYMCAYLCTKCMYSTCSAVLFLLLVSQPAFGGGPWEGKGQPRAGVNTTFKQPGGREGSLR